MALQCMSIPKLGVGVSFRMQQFNEIRKKPASIDWFELITEHFLLPARRSSYVLDFLKERYPLVLHGVSLSIGSSLPLDFQYLKLVKKLAREINTPWISDHLSWGQVSGSHFHDLLPLPYTKDVADHVIEKARIVQDYLEIPFALENVSAYVKYEGDEMEEWDFYTHVVEQAGIYMMLDVNNIYVSSHNLGFDPNKYLANLPYDRIIQIHLAGHREEDEWLIDSHDRPVKNEVWDLYREVWLKANQPSTLLEWDDDFLPFEKTCEEALKAKFFQEEALSCCHLIR